MEELLEKYKKLRDKAKVKHAWGAEHVAYAQVCQAFEAGNPVEDLERWIQQTQKRIVEFEAMQAEGRLVKMGSDQPGERPGILKYEDRKLEIFSFAHVEARNR
jgi:hypothetical protein